MNNSTQGLIELKKWIEEQKEVSQKGYVKSEDEIIRTMYSSENAALGVVVMKIDKLLSESSPPTLSELKQKFAEHLGLKELNTTDAYAIEFAVKEFGAKRSVP